MTDPQKNSSSAAHRRERMIAVAVVGVTAVAVLALLIWNRREAQNIGRGTYIPRAEKMTPEVRLLQQFVQIDTTNPPGNEIAAARWMGERLARFGIPFEIIESAPSRGNLYARIRGKQPGDGLLLLSHTDVVPATAKSWTYPPFEGRIVSNMLWARGAMDMKGIALAHMESLIAVAESGAQPQHDIVLLAVADEESGGALGTQWLLEHRPDVFSGIKYVLAEGGITEMTATELTYYGIEIGSKQIVTLDIAAPSEEQLQRARIHLERFYIRDQPDRVLPEVARFFHQIAPVRLEHRDRLNDIHRTIDSGKFWLLPITYRALTQDIVWPRTIRREGNEFLLSVTMSNLPDANPDDRIAWLEQQVQPFGGRIATVHRKEGPVPISSDRTPLFSILEREVHRAYGAVPVGTELLATSTSDARLLRPRGMTCYGFLPFPADFYQSASIHGTDERVTLDWFTQGVAVMRRVVLAYAGLPVTER